MLMALIFFLVYFFFINEMGRLVSLKIVVSVLAGLTFLFSSWIGIFFVLLFVFRALK